MQYWARDTNGFGGIYCCCPESRIQGILDSIVTNDSCESRTEQSKWSSVSLVASTIFRSSKSPGGLPQDMLALRRRAPGGWYHVVSDEKQTQLLFRPCVFLLNTIRRYCASNCPRLVSSFMEAAATRSFHGDMWQWS